MAKNNGYKRIKDDTHELIYTTETYRLPKQTYGYQRGIIGGRINYEVGINIYTLLYIKYNQQGPTDSTGNSALYSVITYMGKESEKEWIYV